jgi:nitrogen PTS system EIIA component
MNLSQYISERQIKVNLKFKKKNDVLEELVALLVKKGKVSPQAKKKVVSSLVEREKLGSTGIGQGVAIPHVKLKFIKKPLIVVGITEKGIDFDSLDGGLVSIIFLLLSPESSNGIHLTLMSQISKLLQDKFCLQKIKKAQSPRETKQIIKVYETKL